MTQCCLSGSSLCPSAVMSQCPHAKDANPCAVSTACCMEKGNTRSICCLRSTLGPPTQNTASAPHTFPGSPSTAGRHSTLKGVNLGSETQHHMHNWAARRSNMLLSPSHPAGRNSQRVRRHTKACRAKPWPSCLAAVWEEQLKICWAEPGLLVWPIAQQQGGLYL